MKLVDVGGRLKLWREPSGVWHAFVAGRVGWGLTPGEALRAAMRRAWS